MDNSAIEEELKILEARLKQLKLAYEQYFLGSRPREPQVERREVDKTIVYYSNTAIQNTALRFKFNSICSRYNAFKRQWNETLRKIEQGTYERHLFKAELRERDQGAAPERGGASRAVVAADDPALFSAYVEAREACGQETESLTPKKLQAVLDKQARALVARHGGGVSFRVVVENGKAKIRATRV